MASDVPHSDAITPHSSGTPHGSGNGGNTSSGALMTLEPRGGALATMPWNYGMPARPEILTARPGPVELFHALRRRWLLAATLGTTVGLILAAAVWFILPVRYEAETLLRVLEYNPTMGLKEMDTEIDTFEVYKRSQLPLIRSYFVLIAALRNPEISQLSMVRAQGNDPIPWLQDQLVVDFPGDAQILRIAMKGERPAQVAQIVNAVADAYIEEVVVNGRRQRIEQQEKLRATFNEYMTKKAELQKKLNALKREMGFTTSSADNTSRTFLIDQVREQHMLRTTLERDLRTLDMDIKVHPTKKKASTQNMAEYLVESEFRKDPVISDNLLMISRYQAMLEAYERVAKPGSPLVAQMRGQIDDLQQKIDERKHEMAPQLYKQLENMPGKDDEEDITVLKEQRDENQKNLEECKTRIAKLEEEIGKFDRFSTDLERSMEELEMLNKITFEINSQILHSDTALKAPDRISIVQPAKPPTTSNRLQKYITVAFAGLLGVGMIVFGIAYAEFQLRRLNTSREIKDGLGLRVMGELPTLSGRAWRRLQSGKDTKGTLQALLTESIDGIRTALLYTTAVDAPRVILITSAEPHEGKTTVATQLAASLARCGRRTLLIDGDVRHPAVHHMLEVPNEPGFSELLRGDVEREAVVHPSHAPNLWVMPAGRCNVATIHALATKALGEVFDSLRSQFDFVLIDSAPILTVADPLLMGQHVDAVVLSVLRDVSQMPQVYEASERLRSVGCVVLGAVVNGATDRAPRSHAERQLVNTAAPAALEAAADKGTAGADVATDVSNEDKPKTA